MTDDGSRDDKKKGQRNEMRMIARAAAILRALGDDPFGLSLGQLAKETGLARSTVQRLVGALEVERLVVTEAGRAGVRLGSEIPRLANAAHRDIKTLIRPAIEALHLAVNDTVDVSLMQRDSAVVIDQVLSSGRILHVVSQVGTVLPLSCTSNGKAHLAQLPESQLDEILSGALQRRTDKSITDKAQLMDQIAAIRAGEFSEDNEEHTDGVSAISLPMMGVYRGNYAFGALMPTQRYLERKDMIKDALRACQQAIRTLAGD